MWQWALGLLTTENVQKLFQLIAAKLKELAESTENEIDDIMVSALESIANDKEKIEIIANFIKANHDNMKGAVEGTLDYVQLAEYVAFAGDRSKECESIPVEVVAKLLKAIVPYVLDFLFLQWG